MIAKDDVVQCRSDLRDCVGRKVKLRSNGGRKRIIIHEGILDNCYSNVFTVRCSREGGKYPELISFSYVDILTEAVEVAVQANTIKN